MKTYKYIACRNPDRYSDGTMYETYEEARDAAAVFNGCVIELTFTLEDSEMVDDFRDNDKTDDFGFDSPEHSDG